jgi:hypothetical protein
MASPHTLLLRQIKRSFGAESVEALQTLLASPPADEAAKADLEKRLQRQVR